MIHMKTRSDFSAEQTPVAAHVTQNNTVTETKTLREKVAESLENYFAHLGDETPQNLYQLILGEIQPPMLEAVLKYTKGNQSKAAIILGISRGTLYKLLKKYNMN